MEMGNTDFIHHTGLIKSITNNKIIVNLIRHSLCGTCHAKGICSVSEVEEKLVEIFSYNKEYIVGEEVNVVLKKSLGFKALFLSYILPLIILLITLFLSFFITKNEGLAGLFSVGILLPYYSGLYFFKGKIDNAFNFEIEKLR